MTDSPFIINVTEQNFEQEVLINSMAKPVFVDFWAGWCNPCKMLMPILRKLAIEYDGAFHLAKVDSDQEKNLSAHYGIRNLPTVKIFKQGEVVDEFHGAIPESAIKEFIEKHIFRESDFTIQEAEDAFSDGDFDKTKELLDKILADDNSNKKAIILSAKISLLENKPDQAEVLLKNVSIATNDDEDIHQLKILIALSKEVENAADIETLKSDIEQENKLSSRYQLACRYALTENYEDALKLFVEIVEEDKTYKDGAARKQIVAIFDLLGGSGPLVNVYRIKLSRLLH